MSILICPVCRNVLKTDNSKFYCINNHTFDISKKGYVNLLMSNASSAKRHGDDKAMVVARTDFLNRGYFKRLSDLISEKSSNCINSSPIILDCGCGECYYINEVNNRLLKENKTPVLYGMDISKEALPYGKKRLKEITLFVASVFKIPVIENSVDIALNVFAPICMDEMARIVKKDGVLIKVFPLENHLIELKRCLYENVYLNRPVVEQNDMFELRSTEKLEYTFELKTKEEIESLFKMTPYYYKTSEYAQKKLSEISELEVTGSFGISKYIRK